MLLSCSCVAVASSGNIIGCTSVVAAGAGTAAAEMSSVPASPVSALPSAAAASFVYNGGAANRSTIVWSGCVGDGCSHIGSAGAVRIDGVFGSGAFRFSGTVPIVTGITTYGLLCGPRIFASTFTS